MATVVRLGPLPLRQRRPSRIAELERILGSSVQLIEVSTVADLAASVASSDVVAVALDASSPGELGDAVQAAGSLPVLRPLWRRARNTRGESFELFDGYGLLTPTGIVGLDDGSLSSE